MAHKHAQAMALYAQDALEMNEPFKNWEFRVSYSEGEWEDMPSHPAWNIDCEYRRKPNQARVDMEAFNDWYQNEQDNGKIYPSEAWTAALEWERSKK